MKDRARILILIPHLGGGGAERVVAHLAAGLSGEFEVHIGLVAQNSRRLENIDNVKTYDLGATRVRFSGRQILKLIRVTRPDLVMSGTYHLNLLVLLLKPLFAQHPRIVVRQNASPRLHSVFGSRFLCRLLYKYLYPRADAVICQSSEMQTEMIALFKTHLRCCVLPNPVDVRSIRSACAAGISHRKGPHLLAVGRLAREKGFDLLIEALSQVRAQISTVHLTILGTGPEEKTLRSTVSGLGLTDAVYFEGEVEKPESWFGNADIFVLPSRADTVPNALLEAAAAGLPIVATPASTALNRMLHQKPGVWLADRCTAASLAQAIIRALEQLNFRHRFDHAWIAPFEKSTAITSYARLFRSILSGELV